MNKTTHHHTIHRRQSRGFTIVELLIIIVVIAILAAISVVAYRGVQQRANDSSASSTAQQAARKIIAYYTAEGRYPEDLEEADLSDIADSLEYDVNNGADPASFCVTATTNTSSFYVSNTQRSPREGGCPGHSVGGVEPVIINNLISNPGFESGVSGWNPTGTATRAQSSDQVRFGNSSLYITGTNSNDEFITHSVNLQPNQTYTISAWVYLTGVGATRNDRNLWLYNQPGGMPAVNVSYDTSLVSQWQRLSQTITVVNSSLMIRVYPMRDAPLYIDGIMITEGDQLYEYADGDSPGWSWNGTPHNSTSTGPAL